MAITPRRKAIADASMAATRLHLALKTPFDRPVDVVTLAQQLGVWVVSEPMDALYGFYLREPRGSCIVLNSKHPETLQRFTCGHEIGHHVLGHESLTDVRESITAFHGPLLDLTELAAQTFAASLLMPLPLVNAVLRSFVHERRLAASDAYVVSRELGVSYSAAVVQLESLGKITSDEARALASRKPLAVKSELRGGRERIADARADLWLLTDQQNGAVLQCRVGDEFHLRLPEDLSLGRQWQLEGLATPARVPSAAAVSWSGDDLLQLHEGPDLQGGPGTEPASASALEVVVDEHVGAEPIAGVAGPTSSDHTVWPDLPEGGSRQFILLAREPGRHILEVRLTEPWLVDPSPAALFQVTLEVAPRRRLAEVGVAQPQREAHVRRLTAA
jgi:Zn-dependent peptidase ImmA (M78 family)